MATETDPAENKNKDLHTDLNKFENEFADRAGSPGFYKASEKMDKAEKEKSASPGSLAAAEGQSEEADSSGTQNSIPYNSSKKKKKAKVSFKMTKKKAIAGAGTGGIIGIIIAFFILLTPLKILSLVTDLSSHFFAGSNNAVQSETQSLFSNYIKQIMPSYRLNSCGTTLDRSCKVTIKGSDPISNLYRTWHEAGLENTIAEKYGIEFKYDKATNTYYLKAPGADDTSEGDPISGTVNSDGSADFSKLDAEFQRSDRTEVRATINQALSNETKWKEVL